MSDGHEKLSETQAIALYAIRENGPLDDFRLLWHVGKSRNVTMRALERLGFARYFPTSELWKLTRDGHVWLNDEDSIRYLAEHQKKTDEIVRRRRQSEVKGEKQGEEVHEDRS